MTSICKPAYLAKVKLLTKEETERLLSRMVGKLPRRLEKDKLSKEEALAIQMELEDEQLQEWRKVMRSLKDKDKAKIAEKAKDAKKPKSSLKVKAPLKAMVEKKAKAPLKAKKEAAK